MFFRRYYICKFASEAYTLYGEDVPHFLAFHDIFYKNTNCEVIF